MGRHSPEDERWPRVDPRDPGVPRDRQDYKVHRVPKLRRFFVTAIFRDLTDPRDRVYNR